MKTRINKSHKFSFLLSEQELRKIAETMGVAASKISEPNKTYSQKYLVRLKDGSELTPNNLDEVLALENSGTKSIVEVALTYAESCTSNEPTWSIHVQFQNGVESKASWNSIAYEIYGPNRDWAFVASADLDEKLNRTKILAAQAFVNNRNFTSLVVNVLLLSMMVSLMSGMLRTRTHEIFKNAVVTEKITDPIQAIARLEEIRNTNVSGASLWMLSGLIGVLLMLTFLGPAIGSISPSYNFYWGDYTREYDRKQKIRTTVGSIVIVGIGVGLLVNYLSKKLGF